MTSNAQDVQVLFDRAAIQDVLTLYFQGLDRGEPEVLRRCFTGDVVARYDGRSALRSGGSDAAHGVDAVIDSLITFRRKAAGEWKVTTHFMGNLNFNRLERDEAETETCAIAFIVLPGQPDQVAMRSLRYLDRLRRTAQGWRICERQHTLDWSCQVSADFAVATGERLRERVRAA